MCSGVVRLYSPPDYPGVPTRLSRLSVSVTRFIVPYTENNLLVHFTVDFIGKTDKSGTG